MWFDAKKDIFYFEVSMFLVPYLPELNSSPFFFNLKKRQKNKRKEDRRKVGLKVDQSFILQCEIAQSDYFHFNPNLKSVILRAWAA